MHESSEKKIVDNNNSQTIRRFLNSKALLAVFFLPKKTKIEKYDATNSVTEFKGEAHVGIVLPAVQNKNEDEVGLLLFFSLFERLDLFWCHPNDLKNGCSK